MKDPKALDEPPQRVTRKNSNPIKVWCLPEEKEIIENHAQTAGLSTSTFLRNVGMGYNVANVIDHQQIHELAKINADQGRLGGLLKLWLTDEKSLPGVNAENIKNFVLELLKNIQNTQMFLLSAVEDTRKKL